PDRSGRPSLRRAALRGTQRPARQPGAARRGVALVEPVAPAPRRRRGAGALVALARARARRLAPPRQRGPDGSGAGRPAPLGDAGNALRLPRLDAADGPAPGPGVNAPPPRPASEQRRRQGVGDGECGKELRPFSSSRTTSENEASAATGSGGLANFSYSLY